MNLLRQIRDGGVPANIVGIIKMKVGMVEELIVHALVRHQSTGIIQSIDGGGGTMSDLKRKYYGLKLAHKELSAEVVALREKVEELEGDIKTSNEILRMADKFVGIVVRERDILKAGMVKISKKDCVCNHSQDPDNFICDICIATTALAATKKEPCGMCGGIGSIHPMVKSPEGGFHLDITQSVPCPECGGKESGE